MKKIKQIISISLICLVAASSITGCKSKKETNSPSSSVTTVESTKSNGNTYPIVDKPLTLTLYCELTANVASVVKNYSEIAAAAEVEKKTGIHIEFKHPPVGGAAEAFNPYDCFG